MVPKRSGHRHSFVAPLGLFKCGGRYIIIIAIGPQWANLAKLLGREDWLDDPRMADPVSRNENSDEINEAIEAWLDTIGDAEKAVKILTEDNHVPAAPVLDVPEVMEHPHMVQRGIVQTIKDPVFGDLKIPASPMRYSQFPEPLELQASAVGEHNEEVLREKLNYSTEQIASLTESGVLGARDDT